jgi:hypothetical protein
MKTSFAKTFKDYSKDDKIIDPAFPYRETVRAINLDDEEIPLENIMSSTMNTNGSTLKSY